MSVNRVRIAIRRGTTDFVSLLAYLLFAIMITWPVARSFSSELAIGVEPAPTVPLFNLWTLWWNCDRWNHGLAGYWDAPIFFPEQGAFAFSEPQPLSGLLVWLLAPVLPTLTACYHVILLLNLTLNGWATMRLLSRVRIGRVTAWLGGGCVAVLPFIHMQLGVLQLTALWPVIWTIAAVRSTMRRPNWKRGVTVGLALATTYLTCHYYALMLGTLLAGTTWILVRPSILWRQVVALIIGAVLAAAVVVPFAWTEISILKARQLSQSREFVRSLSLTPPAYSQTPWQQWLTPPISNLADDGSRWGSSPGTIKAILAVLGLGWGLYRRSLRRWTIFLVVWVVLAFGLSLGTRLEVEKVVPFDWLIRYAPGYSFFRSPFRFALFAQLGVALLAAQGIDGLANPVARSIVWFRRSRAATSHTATRRRFVHFRHAMVVAIGLCAVAEAWPPQPQRFRVAKYDEPPAWAVWLERSTSPDAVFAFIPFPAGTSPTHYQQTVEWMCWQMVHHRRMVNGYSGLFPKSYLDLNQLMQNFVSLPSLERLASQNVDYCVVVGPLNEKLKTSPDAQRSLELVFVDNPSATVIYRLRKTKPLIDTKEH